MNKLLKKIVAVAMATLMAASMAVSAAAYESSANWSLWYNSSAPTSTNRISQRASFSSNGHKNIGVSCTLFEGESDSIVVNFDSFHYDPDSGRIMVGIDDRFTTESKDKNYEQRIIAPYGCTVYVDFEMDLGNHTVGSYRQQGTCHTNA